MSTTRKTRYRHGVPVKSYEDESPNAEDQVIQRPLMPAALTIGAPAVKPAQTELGAAADALNTALQRAEKKLRDLGYGVRASVEVETYVTVYSPEPDTTVCLTFGKRDGKWQLFLETYQGNSEPEESDLLSAGIEIRRKAALAIAPLILALEEAKEHQIAGLTDAHNDLTGLLEDLDQGAFPAPFVASEHIRRAKKGA